jgi:hypothetical protein
MNTENHNSNHPTAEVLAAFLDQTLPEEERDWVAGHLDACDACREELSLAASVLAEGRASKRKRPWLAPLAVAAAIVTLLLLPLGRIVGPDGPATIRRGERSEGTPVLAIVAPQEEQSLRPAEVHFEWRTAEPGAHYELMLTDHQGDIVWSAGTSDTLLALPEDMILEEGLYYWVVDALLEGAREATTDVHQFTIESGD